MTNTSGAGTQRQDQKENGVLHIVRRGGGLSSTYEVTYHRFGSEGGVMQPLRVAGAQGLLDLLDGLGLDFSQTAVKGALEEVLLQGSGTIPEVWLSEEEIRRKGLAAQNGAS